MPNEEYALVLDYLPKGKSSSFKTEPVAQVVGTEFFTLLEVVPKKELKALEKIYVGKEVRQHIEYIKKRITYSELTSNSVAELEKAIEKIIDENSNRFLEFYNVAGPITIKRHQLELLPGLGKKHMLDILKARRVKPFESFEDVAKRVKLMPEPKNAVMRRILEELREDGLNHYIFARPPAKKHEFRR